MNADHVDQLVRLLLSRYLGWTYRPAGAQPYVAGPSPAWMPGRIVRAVHGPRQTDCSTFAGLGVVGHLPGAWRTSSAMALAVGDGSRPWSPIEEAVAAGVGHAVTAPMIGRWHLCQGWTDLLRGAVDPGKSHGHAWLWYGGEDGEMTHASSTAGRVLAEDRSWLVQRKRYDDVRTCVLGEV